MVPGPGHEEQSHSFSCVAAGLHPAPVHPPAFRALSHRMRGGGPSALLLTRGPEPGVACWCGWPVTTTTPPWPPAPRDLTIP